MGQIVTDSVSIDTAGGAGVAAGTGELQVAGYVEWVHYDFHASAPATTDVTLAYGSGGVPAAGNIAGTVNTATDVLQFPRATCVDNAGSAITNSHTRFPVWGPITVSVAQCNALTAAVVVTVGYWQE